MELMNGVSFVSHDSSELTNDAIIHSAESASIDGWEKRGNAGIAKWAMNDKGSKGFELY